MTRRSAMSFRKQLWLHLGFTLVLLGPSVGAGWVLGPVGFKHYHESEHERHAHTHVHGGAHRHDVGSIHSHDHAPASPTHRPTSPSKPQPERDDDTPAGRFVPAAGPAMAHRVGVVESIAAPEPGGLFTPTTSPAPRRWRVDLAASPRAPPA